ncbi:MAG: AzlD domain-containing protein [Sphaerochaetaceae bacterium]|jgi:branched-subunit amino acid transport protein|nr:AzlD domain-containing protein [Sphaerochaetaceae bacterium]
MQHNVYLYILIMAAVTYLVRMLPLAILRKPIHNRYFKSFLYYVPYVSLSVMTFPEILYCTGSPVLGAIALALSIAMSFIGLSLPLTAGISCLAVFVANLI